MRTVLAAMIMAAATPAAAETVVVTAERMLDVVAGRMMDKPAITIVDGRITAIGRAGGPLPAGARLVDLAGLTLLPGLIDMHVHLTGVPEIGGYNDLQYTDSFWTVAATRNARTMLEAGFTTVRNVGASNYADVGVREAVDYGLVPGPRIITAGYAIGATGGHCDETYFPPSFQRKSPAAGDGPDELRRIVREQRKYGARVIKVCATGGVFSRNTEPGQQQLREEELSAIADEARQWGLRTAAHAHGASGIKAAIRAGITTIEHSSLIDDEGIALAKARGAWLSMDIYNTDYTQAEGAKNGVLEDNLRKDREIAETQRQGFRRAHRAGVKMVFGTDAGVMPHGQAAKQFATMVTWGMTPLDAVRSATVNAADALGQGRDVGRIAVGAWGDMIAVAGDPTVDVTSLERPVVVLKGGAIAVDRRPPAMSAD